MAFRTNSPSAGCRIEGWRDPKAHGGRWRQPYSLLPRGDPRRSRASAGQEARGPTPIASSLLEMKDFVGGLPSRLNQVMDAITNHELEVKIKAVDARLMMEGFQKIANRITAGIVLASSLG